MIACCEVDCNGDLLFPLQSLVLTITVYRIYSLLNELESVASCSINRVYLSDLSCIIQDLGGWTHSRHIIVNILGSSDRCTTSSNQMVACIANLALWGVIAGTYCAIIRAGSRAVLTGIFQGRRRLTLCYCVSQWISLLGGCLRWINAHLADSIGGA